MKRIALLFLAMAFVLCAVPGYAQDKDIPNLVGTWQSTGSLHFKEHGFQPKMDKAAEYIVKDQNGRIFHGVMIVHRPMNKMQDQFSGVIARDNKSFYIAGHAEGVHFGSIDGPDDATIYYLFPGGKQPRAGYGELKRVK